MCKENEIKTKACSKCGRELPMTKQYFKPSNKIKCGFEAMCRECMGFEFIENYKDRFYWNDSLENKLREIYYLYTNKEIISNFKEFYKLTCKQIERKGNDLGLHKSEFNLRTQNNKQIPLDYNKRIELYNNFNNIKNGYKMCLSCFRVLEDNSDYFFMKNGKTISTCKECKGHKFTKFLKARDGYKYCIKCERELPNNNSYFPMDSICKDGLRNVCRECGKDGHFMENDYAPKRCWSDDENQLFIKRYPYYTNEELIQFFYPKETTKDLSDRSYRLGCLNKVESTKERANIHKGKIISKLLKGKPKSEETKIKISQIKKEQFRNGLCTYGFQKGRVVSEEERKRMSERRKGIWSGDSNPRHVNPLKGELNGRWEGGLKELIKDLRDHLQEWKKASMEKCNYKCYLTGLEFHNIHHSYPFKNIVNELFEKLHYDKRQVIGDYSHEEIECIYNKLHELHNKYGLGICLNKNIHKLFHDNFGYFRFDKNDFELFKQNYYKGIYDEELDEELKSYNSIKRLKENGIEINLKEAI